ncbi:MAG: hypothetical protein ACJZ8O_00310 [Pirellulaceae bacterium]
MTASATKLTLPSLARVTRSLSITGGGCTGLLATRARSVTKAINRPSPRISKGIVSKKHQATVATSFDHVRL